jgi:hypothetical protein
MADVTLCAPTCSLAPSATVLYHLPSTGYPFHSPPLRRVAQVAAWGLPRHKTWWSSESRGHPTAVISEARERVEQRKHAKIVWLAPSGSQPLVDFGCLVHCPRQEPDRIRRADAVLSPAGNGQGKSRCFVPISAHWACAARRCGSALIGPACRPGMSRGQILGRRFTGLI